MRVERFKYNVIYFLAAVLCLLAGCTKEHLDDCISGLHLRFEFTLHEAGGDRFEEDVQVVRVYLFDSNGVLHQIEEGRGAILNDNYVMRLNLAPDKYTVITWAGSDEDFDKSFRVESMNGILLPGNGSDVVIGKTTLNDFKAFLNSNLAEEYPEDIMPATEHFDDLYYGAVGTRVKGTSKYIFEQVEIKSGEFAERSIELIRNTNLIHLSITGLDYFRTRPTIWVSARNGRYSYDNTIYEYTRLLRYHPFLVSTEQNKITVSIKVARMDLEQRSAKPVLLFIEDPDTGVLFPKQGIDVIDILLQARDPDTKEYVYKNQEDFDRIYGHPIRIEVSADLNMKVFVHNWEVVDLLPELGTLTIN